MSDILASDIRPCADHRVHASHLHPLPAPVASPPRRAALHLPPLRRGPATALSGARPQPRSRRGGGSPYFLSVSALVSFCGWPEAPATVAVSDSFTVLARLSERLAARATFSL